MNDEWVHPQGFLSTTCDEMFILDDWNLDEKSPGKWE